MARPKFKPTNEQRLMVKSLSACGITHEGIARAVGVRSAKTLRKRFRQELDLGAIEAVATVSQAHYQMAKSGKHPASTMHFLATRTRWLDVQRLDSTEKREVSRVVWRPAEPLKKNSPGEGDKNPPALPASNSPSSTEAAKPEVEPPDAPPASSSYDAMPEWWKEQFKKP